MTKNRIFVKDTKNGKFLSILFPFLILLALAFAINSFLITPEFWFFSLFCFASSIFLLYLLIVFRRAHWEIDDTQITFIGAFPGKHGDSKIIFSEIKSYYFSSAFKFKMSELVVTTKTNEIRKMIIYEDEKILMDLINKQLVGKEKTPGH